MSTKKYNEKENTLRKLHEEVTRDLKTYTDERDAYIAKYGLDGSKYLLHKRLTSTYYNGMLKAINKVIEVLEKDTPNIEVSYFVSYSYPNQITESGPRSRKNTIITIDFEIKSPDDLRKVKKHLYDLDQAMHLPTITCLNRL